jgi:hypothetical protein
MGHVSKPARPIGRSRFVKAAAAFVVSAGVVAALVSPDVASSSGRAAPTRFTVYQVATVEQFLNHIDDRQRGHGNNPFGNFQAPTATTRESNGGPFPGDQALFHFNLYSGSDLKKVVGSADFTCSYNFKKNGFCDAAYTLPDGMLLAAGPLDFKANRFSLAVTGGTGKYRSLGGTLAATPAARLSQRLAIELSPIGSAKTARTVKLASVATAEQFLNHADDRQRGGANNPFGNFYQAKQKTSEKTGGPFPGDQAVFTFNLFSPQNLHKQVGSAVFTCNYGFKRHGFCDATYQLHDGTLVAAGVLDFDSKTFSLVVTGGTGKYQAAAGELAASPVNGGSQPLAITLS